MYLSGILRSVELPWDPIKLSFHQSCGLYMQCNAMQCNAIQCIEGNERRTSNSECESVSVRVCVRVSVR